MPNPLVQITINLQGNNLSYTSNTIFPPGGTAIKPVGLSGKRHKIQKNTRIQWICAQDFAVLFSQSPFNSGNTLLSKPQNTPTSPETATFVQDRQKYAVVVYRGGANPIVAEDPELDVSDDGGGGGSGGSKKGAAKKKKSASKKK